MLRRDFVNDTSPRLLRLAVPAGVHDARARGRLDAGVAGREVDVTLASDEGQNWHLNALVMR